jgi:hypothetical protein
MYAGIVDISGGSCCSSFGDMINETMQSTLPAGLLPFSSSQYKPQPLEPSLSFSLPLPQQQQHDYIDISPYCDDKFYQNVNNNINELPRNNEINQLKEMINELRRKDEEREKQINILRMEIANIKQELMKFQPGATPSVDRCSFFFFLVSFIYGYFFVTFCFCCY